MESHGIDASLGLTLAIDLLEHHQQTGELQGTISITKLLKTKRYRCIIQVEYGQVVSCTLFDDLGRRSVVDKRYLIHVDEKGGPFDWTFYPREEALSASAPVLHPSSGLPVPVSMAASTVRDDAVPVRLASELQLSWLTTWSENDIRFLHQIFSLVNGRRTIRDIKALMFRVSPGRAEKALVFLIAMKQIEIRN
ncbi:MAG: hypothetical protein J2P37_08355 [Ktedonobacteraceae bacterium]|nr:hypothetical protein [Ktedonobacteraceae bacterium]MBO0790718.1 hypothetical protein [Ktedonobacteraceae bacterium]